MEPALFALVAVLAFSALPAADGRINRIRMHDYCEMHICTGITIGPEDFVLMSTEPMKFQTMLTFVNSSIAKIPHLMFDTFPDLQILRVENCSLSTFENPQFIGASNLMALMLLDNKIRQLPDDIFRGASNLNTLSLAGNQLEHLRNQSFTSLNELLSLDLSRNRLNRLSSGAFGTLLKLIEINLSNNKLTTMPLEIFDKNRVLSKVELAGNNFANFESEYFRNQPRLKLLDISRNPLVEVTINFESLDILLANDCDIRKLTLYGFLRDVEVRNNSLQTVPHFPHAANVSMLDMSHNPIVNLEATSLRPLVGLSKLNLSHAQMHDLPQDLFKKQQKLKLLDISENSLYNLKVSVFDNLKALEFFFFQGNNWNCDFLQLLMSSFVKPKEIAFEEDDLEPSMVDNFVDGVACWYENSRTSKKCSEGGESVLQMAIIRDDIKAFVNGVDTKFNKLFRMIDEIKSRL